MSGTITSTIDRLRDEGVHAIDYFHCDHFEPWRRGVRMSHVDETLVFLEAAENLWFAKRLTLFYKPQISYLHFSGNRPENVVSLPDEQIGFYRRTELEVEAASHCMRRVAERDHEIQVHIHHEGFTQSDVAHDVKVRQWLTEHGTESSDEARLDLAIKLHLKAIREETGMSLQRWLFVHGNWALNGSDHQICRIKNEIRILMENGCVGDMTFPAGRRHVDPSIHKTSYNCVPNSQDKGYDFAEAEPFCLSDQRSRAQGRFFIWNSSMAHPIGSIDYSSKVVRKLYQDPDAVVLKWLTQAPIFNGKLFIKTYAHSMFRQYWEDLPNPVIPHAWPEVQMAFNRLREATEKLGMGFNLVTAGEVYQELANGKLPDETPCLELSAQVKQKMVKV